MLEIKWPRQRHQSLLLVRRNPSVIARRRVSLVASRNKDAIDIASRTLCTLITFCDMVLYDMVMACGFETLCDWFLGWRIIRQRHFILKYHYDSQASDLNQVSPLHRQYMQFISNAIILGACHQRQKIVEQVIS